MRRPSATMGKLIGITDTAGFHPSCTRILLTHMKSLFSRLLLIVAVRLPDQSVGDRTYDRELLDDKLVGYGKTCNAEFSGKLNCADPYL